MKTLLLVVSFLLSFLLTVYIVYSVKATGGESEEGFFGSLMEALRVGFTSELGSVLHLLASSFIVIASSLFTAAAIGYSLAGHEIPRWLKLILSFPEIFFLVILDLVMSGMGFRIRGLSNFGKFAVIFSIVVARRWLVFHDYFRISMKDFEESTAYKLMLTRGIRSLWKYRLKNTILDSMSSLTFEIPLMISYVAIMEQVVVYRGISFNFLRSLETSLTSQVPLIYAFFISATFVFVQALLRWAVSVRDRRSVGI